MNRHATGDGAMYANVETPNQEQKIRLIRRLNQVDDILLRAAYRLSSEKGRI